MPVKQINTDGRCHLEAQMISDHLADWDLAIRSNIYLSKMWEPGLPVELRPGRGLRVVLLSVTEGEDKPLKYPNIFNSADTAVITKMDLAEACEFDLEAAQRNIRAVRPGMRILTTSSKSGAGMEEWLECLAEEKLARCAAV